MKYVTETLTKGHPFNMDPSDFEQGHTQGAALPVDTAVVDTEAKTPTLRVVCYAARGNASRIVFALNEWERTWR
jgi:hypothetical protein